MSDAPLFLVTDRGCSFCLEMTVGIIEIQLVIFLLTFTWREESCGSPLNLIPHLTAFLKYNHQCKVVGDICMKVTPSYQSMTTKLSGDK